jgi:hypothetical protein
VCQEGRGITKKDETASPLPPRRSCLRLLGYHGPTLGMDSLAVLVAAVDASL